MHFIWIYKYRGFECWFNKKKTSQGLRHTGAISALVLLKNGSIASGSFDTTIKIWNIEDGALKRTLTGHKSGINNLILLKNGDLVDGSYDLQIKISKIEDGSGHTRYVFALKQLENGDLVSGSEDGKTKHGS